MVRDRASLNEAAEDCRLRDETQLTALRSELLRYCEFLSGSRHDAEDLVQTTLLKVLPILRGQNHPNLSALLRRVAKTTWIDTLRKQRRLTSLKPEHLLVSESAQSADDFLRLEGVLEVFLSALTKQQQAVIILCDVLRYSNWEAARLLDRSPGAVKATLHRARVKLDAFRDSRQEVQDEGIQPEILEAYLSAFAEADIRALIHLCRDGVVDSVQATSKVLTLSEKKTRPVNNTTTTLLLAA